VVQDCDEPIDSIEPLDSIDAGATIRDSRLPPGFELGGYVIEGELGTGGMGVVYAAIHPLIGKRAAIKVLKPSLSKDGVAVERFRLEARAVNQIRHPNIVDIFAFGVLPDGRSYYVMDLLVGEALRTRLRRGRLPVSDAVRVIADTASALGAAHAAGIIHRDLKPDNVFLASVPGRPPEVKLLDWGLAKLAPRAAGSYQPRTVSGSVIGTPRYMSPEQARASGEVDHRTDIYALGVVAYELLAGVVPFQDDTSIDVLVAHQEDPVPPLAERVPGLPAELAQLIEAMLAKQPADRPTLEAVQAVLERLFGPTRAPMLAPPPTDATPAPPVLSGEVTNPRGVVRPGGAVSPHPVTKLGYQMSPLQAGARGSEPGLTPSPPAPHRRRWTWIVLGLAALAGAAAAIALAI
jgi:serine/threonine-protein kinase